MTNLEHKIGNRIGDRLIQAGLITEQQCEELIQLQAEYRQKDIIVRLGEIAVIEGYCSVDDIEGLPGYIGVTLVQQGVITEDQRQLVLRWQSQLKEKKLDIRFGDIAVNEGICVREDLESIVYAKR